MSGTKHITCAIEGIDQYIHGHCCALVIPYVRVEFNNAWKEGLHYLHDRMVRMSRSDLLLQKRQPMEDDLRD